MRNVLIVGAVVVAGALGYAITQQQKAAVDETRLLDYVPADVVFFSGQIEPFPMKDYLQNQAFARTELPPELKDELEHGDSPQGKFFLSLLASYFAAVESEQQFMSTFGLPDQFEGAAYNIGLMPVLRYKTDNPQAIWELFDQAEKDSGLSHEQRILGEASYRAYVLSQPEQDEQAELLVAVNEEGWVSLTLSTTFNETADVEIALGLRTPEQALAQTNTLAEIAQQHSFMPASLGFIDHVGLVTALTTEQGNSTARMLTKVLAATNDNQSLAPVRNPACNSEMTDIANGWPRTAFGLQQMDIQAEKTYLKAAMVVESTSPIMQTVASLQGYLPSYLQEKTIFGYGLGLDINQLSGALAEIWNAALQPQYQCQPLQQMQAAFKTSNPAVLGMFMGMAQGIKGSALAVNHFDADFTVEPPRLTELDAIVSLSADAPDVLFNIAKTFAPPLAPIELPSDGSVVDLSTMLPLPPSINIQPMLAKKGQHLVIYTGEKSQQQAEALANEALVNNGTQSLSIDYQAFFEPILPLLEASIQQEPELVDQLETLKNLNMWIKFDTLLSAKGIEMISEMELHKAANN